MTGSVLKRPAAVAWTSGGSSSHPRKGKPLGRNAKTPLQNKGQQKAKSGATRLQSRTDVKKKPASHAPYTPVSEQRNDQVRLCLATAKSEIKLETLLKKREKPLVQLLWKCGHLHKHATCYHCEEGALSPLQVRSMSLQRRCRKKGCQKWNDPRKGSRVFSAVRGRNAVLTLQKQAAILFCASWGVPQRFVPALIEGVAHQGVERIYTSWRGVLSEYVSGKQDSIKFGSEPCAELDELEADGAVFRKTNLPGNEVQWQEFHGLKRRGDRTSLHLEKRSDEATRSARSATTGRAVPPPLSVVEWRRAEKRLGGNSLLHTDGARAYNAAGVLHDSVSHSHRHGQKGHFTKPTRHVLADGSQHKAQAGTQCLDGWWRVGKRDMFGVKASLPHRVEQHLRESQWRHWLGNSDRWAAAGEVLSWIPE
jgi:hypothetical protein